jgi:hypothetical protein
MGDIDFSGPFPRKVRGKLEALIVPLIGGRARIGLGIVGNQFFGSMW